MTLNFGFHAGILRSCLLKNRCYHQRRLFDEEPVGYPCASAVQELWRGGDLSHPIRIGNAELKHITGNHRDIAQKYPIDRDIERLRE